MITAWLAMTVATVASDTIGNSAQSGNIRKNGFSTAVRIGNQQRALPQIIQRQRRQYDDSQAVWIGRLPKWPRSA